MGGGRGHSCGRLRGRLSKAEGSVSGDEAGIGGGDVESATRERCPRRRGRGGCVVHYGHVGWTVGRATRVRTRKGIRETTR